MTLHPLTQLLLLHPDLAASVVDPTWAATVTARDGAKTALREVREEAAKPTANVALEARAAFLAGRALTGDLGKKLIDERLQAERLAAAEVTLRDIIDDFESDLDVVAQRSTGDLYSAADVRLQSSLDAGEEAVAALGTARSADEAIELGVTEAWSQLRTAHGDYLAARGIQRVLTQTLDKELAGQALSSGRHAAYNFRKPIESYWPGADDPLPAGGHRRTRPSPLPEDAGSVDFFLYVVQHRTHLDPGIDEPAVVRRRTRPGDAT